MQVYKASSLKELLSINVLNKVVDNIEDININSIDTSGLSGSKMYKLSIRSSKDEKNLYLKVNNLKEDWLAKASNDKGRELVIFKDGIYNKIEEFIKEVYIAYYENGDYYAVLMNDMSESIGSNKNSDDYYAYLNNLAKFHAKFSEYDVLKYKSLLSIEEYYYFLTEDKMSLELKEEYLDGYEKIKALLGTNLYLKYSQLKDIDNVFNYYPKTFLHGDYRPDNVVYISKDDIRFIDWANSGCGPCTLDLFWYLMSSVDYKADKIDLIYYYKRSLEMHLGYLFTKKTWETLLKVGIICSCRMFLAALASKTNLNDRLEEDNLNWWSEALIDVLNSI